MAMAVILEVVQDSLRKSYNWQNETCRVILGGEPPDNLGADWFVGIDEDGIEAGPMEEYTLTEIFRIKVYVWRRCDNIPRDHIGKLMVAGDVHLAHMHIPHPLERKLLNKNTGGLHWNYDIITKVNERLGTPTAENGSGLNSPFRYQGRGNIQYRFIDNGGGQSNWVGYAMRFGGAKRTQSLSCQS